jgi:RNA polymerase primary sigma factor
MSAKELVRYLNSERGTAEIRKRDINPTLYRHSEIFRYQDQSPPRWFIRLAKKQPTKEKHSQLPVPPMSGTRTDVIPPKPPSPKVYDTPVDQPTFNDLSKDLYPWQQNAIRLWREAGYRGVIEAVTGTGKTLVAISLIREYIEDQKRCLVVVPSQILLRQWKEELERELGIDLTSLLGAEYGRQLDRRQLITLGVVNTVAAMQKSDDLRYDAELIIIDECHRFAADLFQHALIDSAPHRLGLTATFERSDDALEEILSPYFTSKATDNVGDQSDVVCCEYGFRQATQDKVIAPYILGSISVNLSEDEYRELRKCGETMGKTRKQLQAQYGYPADFKAFFRKIQRPANVRQEGIIRQRFLSAMNTRRQLLSESESKVEVVAKLEDLIRQSSGTLIYTESIQSAERVALSFSRSTTISVEAHHSKLRTADRERLFDGFRNKDINCLVAVHTLDEGINVPDANLAIIVSGSQQRRQMIQRMGRVLRKKHDGTGSVFIHIYAANTAEDPNCTQDDGNYLSILREHTNSQRQFLSDAVENDLFSWVKSERIWDKHDAMDD